MKFGIRAFGTAEVGGHGATVRAFAPVVGRGSDRWRAPAHDIAEALRGGWTTEHLAAFRDALSRSYREHRPIGGTLTGPGGEAIEIEGLADPVWTELAIRRRSATLTYVVDLRGRFELVQAIGVIRTLVTDLNILDEELSELAATADAGREATIGPTEGLPLAMTVEVLRRRPGVPEIGPRVVTATVEGQGEVCGVPVRLHAVAKGSGDQPRRSALSALAVALDSEWRDAAAERVVRRLLGDVLPGKVETGTVRIRGRALRLETSRAEPVPNRQGHRVTLAVVDPDRWTISVSADEVMGSLDPTVEADAMLELLKPWRVTVAELERAMLLSGPSRVQTGGLACPSWRRFELEAKVVSRRR